jgi:hypothetical protein
MTNAEIISICEGYEIIDFEVTEDGFVNVLGNIDLRSKNLTKIPVKFGMVGGDFDIVNNKLTSLAGSPYKVIGDFNCSHNYLKSLVLGPKIVQRNYICSNNFLNSLYGSPKTIGGNFSCFINKLTNLKGSPEDINGDFHAYENDLSSLLGSPIQVGGNYYIAGNPDLQNLVGCPELIGGDFVIDDTLLSLFSGLTDCEVKGKVKINMQINLPRTKLHNSIIKNHLHLKYVLKYQRYLEIWNDDLSLNEEYFEELIEEIKDGLL